MEATTRPKPPSGPRKYMSKRQSACDACRARKSACQIETSPPCRLCVAHSKQCTFNGHKVKRSTRSVTSPDSRRRESDGRQSNAPTPTSLTSSLQPPSGDATGPNASSSSEFTFQSDDWNYLFFTEGDIDPVITVDGLLQPIDLNTVRSEGFHGEGMEHFDPSFFDDIFKGSPQFQEQERSLDNLPSMTAQLCGLTGDMDPYVLRRYRYNDNGEFEFSKLSIRTTQDNSMPVQFLLSPIDLSTDSRIESELEEVQLLSWDNERERLSSLIPTEIGTRLIRLFFDFVCPQFPILSKSDPPDPELAPVHLLAAIYCVAQPFAIYDDRLCIDFAYKTPSTQILFNIAWKSLNRALGTPTIATVQSSLVLLLRPPVNELVLDSAFKWSLLGTLVSAAQTIGLHLDASRWKLPRQEIMLRKRLSWAVFVFDKWLALSLGRPSHIRRNDWLIIELEVPDIEEELGSSASEQRICLQLSYLTSILDRVLSELYSIRTTTSLASDYKTTLELSRSLLDLLTSWYQSLDSSFHAPEREDLSSDPDPRFSIHLCYHAVKITIIRALLRPFYVAGATPPLDPREREEWLSAKHYCRLGAKTSANAAVKHVSSLRARDYQAFCAPWCKTHLALITNLLCLLAITSPPEDFTIDLSSLNQARGIFRVQARSFSIIRFALLRIDALFWVGLDTVIDNRNVNNDDTMRTT